MNDERCFLCGASGALKRVQVEVSRTEAQAPLLHHHGHHHVLGNRVATYEYRALCETCVAARAAAAQKLLTAATGGVALVAGLTGLSMLLPVVLCLGTGAVFALLMFLAR